MFFAQRPWRDLIAYRIMLGKDFPVLVRLPVETYHHDTNHCCICWISADCVLVICSPKVRNSGWILPVRYFAISIAPWWCEIISTKKAFSSVAPVCHASIPRFIWRISISGISDGRETCGFDGIRENERSLCIIEFRGIYSGPYFRVFRSFFSIPAHTHQTYAPTMSAITIPIRTHAHPSRRA